MMWWRVVTQLWAVLALSSKSHAAGIIIKCQVKDATLEIERAAVSGAECILLSNAGIFLKIAKDLTNSYGVGVIEDVRPGNYKVRASRVGYYTLSEDLTIDPEIPAGTMITVDMAISPRLSLSGNGDTYRIVLTWGNRPKDLDSYLLTPWPRGRTCYKGMIYYDAKKCRHGFQMIDLDVDATNMYGPETITLTGVQSETFSYYVYIYTNGICWDKISAKINVYQASTGGLLYNIDQPRCSSGQGFTSANCSRYWHVLDFDASTAKFKIYNKLTATAPTLRRGSSANPNCTCEAGKYGVTGRDVIESAAKLSETAKELMVDKLCVDEMKSIYKRAIKREVNLNPSQLASTLAQFISNIISKKRLLALNLKRMIEEEYEKRDSTANDLRHMKMEEIAKAQCCRYDGDEVKYSTKFHRWVDTKSGCWSWPKEINQLPQELLRVYAWTEPLDQIMKDNFHQQSHELKWQYFADDSTGLFRKFPAERLRTSECGTVDQRLQPWYIEAVREPENIIILFDISYTMKEDNKIEFAKTAIMQVLKGLLPNDFTSVIAFAESALSPGMTHGGLSDDTYDSCFATQLVQANAQNVHNLRRFLQDVPLASEKTSNYYNAISTALGLVTTTNNKRQTRFILVAGSQDGSKSDFSVLLSRSNVTATVYAYVLSKNQSNTMLLGETIQKLNKVTNKQGGQLEIVSEYRELAFRIGRFYKNIHKVKHERQKPHLTSPYFDERLGMYVTLGEPCYSKSKKLIGVVGIDIALSELLRTTVSLGPGDLSYTFVIETNSGRCLVHPQLPEPELVKEEPVVIKINDLETSPGFSEVLASMMRRETGTKTLISERVLPRGDPNFNGYRGVKTAFTYSWKPVNNTDFAVCVVVSDNELETKAITVPKPYSDPDLYHRYDFVKHLKVGSIIEDKPIAFLSNTSFPATLSRSNYYLSSNCFVDPYLFENTKETLEFVKTLSDFVDGKSKTPPTPALKDGVLADIRLTRELEQCWNRNPMRVLGGDAAWRYIATNSGAMRQYPGRQTYNNRYDPTTRPWYHAARTLPGKVTFSVPYLDNGGAGVVVTTSQTISSDSMVRAVMGIDFKMKKIHEIVRDSGAICKQDSVTCMLIDPNGYVVYSERFMSRPSMAKERVHLAYKHPELLLKLMEKNIISTSLACNDLELGQTYINYKIADEIPDDRVEGSLKCGAYVMVPVPNTNVYLVALDGGNCPDAHIQCTSCSKKSCADGITKDNSQSSPICVPCTCSVKYNPCALHYYKNPNAGVACPAIPRAIASDQIACEIPDTSHLPLPTKTAERGLKKPSGTTDDRGAATSVTRIQHLWPILAIIVLTLDNLS